MKKKIFWKLALMSVIALLVGCSGGGGGNPATIDSTKEPLKAYAAELRYQYDLVLKDKASGQMSQADIDALLASWKRIGGFFKAAKAAFLDLPQQGQANFVESNFKYPWITPGSVQSLGDFSTWVPAGFLGTGIGKKDGEILVKRTEAEHFLLTDWDKPSGNSTGYDPTSLDIITFEIAMDLDPLLKVSQKKALAESLVDAIATCFPEKKLTLKKLIRKGEGFVGDGSASPFPDDWL